MKKMLLILIIALVARWASAQTPSQDRHVVWRIVDMVVK